MSSRVLRVRVATVRLPASAQSSNTIHRGRRQLPPIRAVSVRPHTRAADDRARRVPRPSAPGRPRCRRRSPPRRPSRAASRRSAGAVGTRNHDRWLGDASREVLRLEVELQSLRDDHHRRAPAAGPPPREAPDTRSRLVPGRNLRRSRCRLRRSPRRPVHATPRAPAGRVSLPRPPARPSIVAAPSALEIMLARNQVVCRVGYAESTSTSSTGSGEAPNGTPTVNQLTLRRSPGCT